jgi:hypothetical protein
MTALENVKKAFSMLIKTGELGNTDANNLKILLGHLDVNAQMTKASVIKIIALSSVDPDASYRTFVSRIKGKVEVLAKEYEDKSKKDIFKTMSIENIKSKLVLKATMPKELVSTERNMQAYNEEEYVTSKGTSKDVMKYFISYASKDAKDANLFKDTLDALTKNDETYTQWNMVDLELGEDFDERIKKELKECNYGIVLLSTSFLESDYIMDIEVNALLKMNKILPVGLVGTIDSLSDVAKNDKTKALMKKEIFMMKDRGREDFFGLCSTQQCRKDFVVAFYERLQTKIQNDKTNPQKKVDDCIIDISRLEEYRDDVHLKQKGNARKIEDNIEKLKHPKKMKHSLPEVEEDAKSYENKISVQKDLDSWVRESKTPLYAILGEYGMGKTFNCRIFARKLKKKHDLDNISPAIVYIDLRDISTTVKIDGEERLPYVDEVIGQILRKSENKNYTAQEVIEANQAGELVIVFDGLDEKMTHYNKEEQQRFLAELLSILNADDETKQERKQKILLSCRSHYFESVSQENSFLRGQGRIGIDSHHYRSIDILPLDMDSMKEFAKKHLSLEEGQKLIMLLESEAYLKGIASRPFMLNKISNLLPRLMKRKKEGKELNTKMFYHALVEDTLDRDDEKHTMDADDKKELLSVLAMELHQRGEQYIDISELNTWFKVFLQEHKVFAIYLRDNSSLDILKRDLRNSTLLVRFGQSDFGFSHSSIYEYFLSEYLVKNWGTLAKKSIFSPLTQMFVLESIALLTSKQKEALHAQIEKTLTEPFSSLSSLALQMLSRLDIPMDYICLSKAKLQGFRFENIHVKKLEVLDSDLGGAYFYKVHADEVVLQNSNLNSAYFKNTSWKKVHPSDTSLRHITSYQSELNLREPADDYHDFCHKDTFENYQTMQNGHSNAVNSVAYSPDGQNILSGSWDGTTRTFMYASKSYVSGWILTAQKDEWYSIDTQKTLVKGTAQSWKLSTLHDKHNNVFRIDRLKGFEVVEPSTLC